MYEPFYGLRELPFENTFDPRFLFHSDSQREAFRRLQHGLTSAKALTVLVGGSGLGKTTLLSALPEDDACRLVECVYANGPAITHGELAPNVVRWFKIAGHAAGSMGTLLVALHEELRTRLERGMTTALVIDDAQTLSDEVLQDIRLLTNLETRGKKLLPIVLAGLPELDVRLTQPGLRPLKDRIAVRSTIRPFTLQETARYMASRIRVAGGDPAHLFSKEATALVHECSGGVPGLINILCDNALLQGMARGEQTVVAATVREVARELGAEPSEVMPEAPSASARTFGDARIDPRSGSNDESREVTAPVCKPGPAPQDGPDSGLGLEELDDRLAGPLTPPVQTPSEPAGTIDADPPRTRFRLFLRGVAALRDKASSLGWWGPF